MGYRLGPRDLALPTMPWIAGGEQDPSPAGAPDPQPIDDPVARAVAAAEQARQQAEDATRRVGQLADENATLRARLDARELRGYAPTLGDGQAPKDAPDRLTAFLREGIDDAEWAVPTGETLVKIVAKTGVLTDNRIEAKIREAQVRTEIDEMFWDDLAEKWQKDAKSLKRRYATDVRDISNQVLTDPATGQTKGEYRANHELAFTRVREALERKLQMVAEDAPGSRPKPRAGQGDAGGARLPAAQSKDASKKEMDSLAAHVGQR